MGPMDAELVRVYTRRPNETVADVTFTHNQQFEVCVDVETGNAMAGMGAQFRLDVTVRCLTHTGDDVIDNDIRHIMINGNTLQPEWPTPKYTFELGPYQCAHLNAGAEWNDVYEVIAVLNVGATNPDVSFARSPLFTCQKA